MAKYKAEVDGVSRIRSSARVLSHAWACRESDSSWYIGGFSTSEVHAKKSIEQFCQQDSEKVVLPALRIDDGTDEIR